METSELEMTPPDSPKATKEKKEGAVIVDADSTVHPQATTRASKPWRRPLKHPEPVDAPSQSGAYPCPFV